MTPIISIVAYSGTGKTTFIEKLLPELKALGLRVAVIKHDAHEFEIDKEGKDSDRITKAGADITGLISDTKAVLMENRPRKISEILDMVDGVDLILTEGYKTAKWPKIMLHREATGKDLPLNPKEVLAVVSDVSIKGAKKQFDLNDAKSVADFIYDYMASFDRNSRKKNPLYHVEFFENVQKETLDGLWKDGHVEEFRKGSVLIEARSMSETIFIQITGKSMVYNLTHSGERKVIFIFGEGILLNDHVLNDHTPSIYCETMTKSKIFVISKKLFLRWLEKDFTLTTAILKIQEWKMWRTGHQLKNTSRSIYMERKLAAKLWKLGRDFGHETDLGIEIDMNLSITFLSDMLGAPRETTSRLCKTLTDYGLISIDKKRITILDPDQLAILYKKGSIGNK